MKRILILGPGSCIAGRFRDYLSRWPEAYETEGLSLRDDAYRTFDFGGYHAVLYAAGIVHRRERRKDRPLYERVNCRLALETAKRAKEAGARQFIYLSSVSVYGMTTGVIVPETQPRPVTAYGRSKLHGEEALRPLADGGFAVTLLRLPMVYGPGCKGSCRALEKLAAILPVCPDYENRRSCISIEALCAFLRRCVDTPESGLYLPQDPRYFCTCKAIRALAAEKGRRIPVWRWLDPAVWLLAHTTKKGRKAFGDLIYQGGHCIRRF